MNSALLQSTFHFQSVDRQKITGCVARGGIADRDAPNCQESTKYWANVTTEETTVTLWPWFASSLPPPKWQRPVKLPRQHRQVLLHHMLVTWLFIDW